MSNEGLDSSFGGRLLDSVSTPENPGENSLKFNTLNFVKFNTDFSKKKKKPNPP